MSQVIIDTTVCVGSGICEALAPAVFAVGPDGVSHAQRDIRADDTEDISEAVRSCPTGALRLLET